MTESKHYSIEFGSNVVQSNVYAYTVVIPVFSELQYISHTLVSLSKAVQYAFKKSGEKTLIILVINNSEPENNIDRLHIENNQILLKKLRSGGFDNIKSDICISWIDASSPGCEIRRKDGVGFARKIGMDRALSYLDNEKEPLIFSLDADTLVDDNYIVAAGDFFHSNPDISGAVTDFRHQPGTTPEEEKAIRLYETFIRHYTDGLKKACSPYAYHSIGSTIVCRASAYIKAAGMRIRSAGEDFYFLQALCKTGISPNPVRIMSDVCVYPSSRESFRVPFGTGPKVTEYIAKIKYAEKNNIYEEDVKKGILYHNNSFDLLGEIISGVENGQLEISLNTWFSNLPSKAKKFLDTYNFRKTWVKILKNTPNDSVKIKWAFHTWFDALKTLQFIHFCESGKNNKISNNPIG